MARFSGLLGIIMFMLIAYLLSTGKKRIPYKTVISGIALQVLIALFMLKTPVGVEIFKIANKVFLKLQYYSNYAAKLLFGELVESSSINAKLAFSSLPLIIFVSAIMGILVYFGVIQFIIKLLARLFYKTLYITGVEAFTSSLLILLGIESFTGVKDYLENMNESRLFTIMTTYMSTIAGSVMAVYVSYGASAGHLFTASIMSVPAAFVISKIMIPDPSSKEEDSLDKIQISRTEGNVIEAAANGTIQGLNLSLYVGAMILAFVAIIWLFNDLFSLVGLTLEDVLSYIFAPFAFLIGIPVHESVAVGKLLGIKTFFNEFLSFLNLKTIISGNILSTRSIEITTYALCGFANLGSMGIILGGIKSIVPSKFPLASRLAFKSIIAGTLATFMTAALVSLIV